MKTPFPPTFTTVYSPPVPVKAGCWYEIDKATGKMSVCYTVAANLLPAKEMRERDRFERTVITGNIRHG